MWPDALPRLRLPLWGDAMPMLRSYRLINALAPAAP